MAKVTLELTMSLDGCTYGPDVSEDEPMGRGGEELRLHLAPIVLGGGGRLFDAPLNVGLRPVEAVATPLVTHLTYEVSGTG